MRGWGWDGDTRTRRGRGWVQFLISLGMARVTGKYIRIGYGDGECKTRPHPAPMPCLLGMYVIMWISYKIPICAKNMFDDFSEKIALITQLIET